MDLDPQHNPIIAIDYGTSHIGVAISDKENTIAKALPPLEVKRESKQLDKLTRLVKQHYAKKILIGLPYGLQSKETSTSKLIKSFANKLEKASKVPVIKWDETATTQLAEDKYKGRKDKSRAHSEAARILLQEYLDFLSTGI